MARIRTSVGAPASPLSVTRPESPAHAIDRPDVWDRITASVDSFRVTLVLAPAGFGKTAALSAWAARSDRKVGWLSLTAADRHSAHLLRGLVTVFEGVARSIAVEDPSAGPGGDTVDDAEQPVVIIDDIQFADTAGSRELLAGLVQRTDLGVRVILSGRHEPRLGLSRLRAAGQLGQLSADHLAFSTDEVRRAAVALGWESSDQLASRLSEYTEGWPVAVRLALMTEAGLHVPLRGSEEHVPQFLDYLAENLLDVLPDRLAAFVPRACVCDRITGPLARELSGDSGSAELLEECVGMGMPLERRTLSNGELVYLWHPVMAQAGRAILARRDPELTMDLHRRAARALAAVDPYEAVKHAFSGHDPGLAAEVIRTEWLALVMRGDCELLDDLCGRLPTPWCDDPEILLVRAACGLRASESVTALQLSAGASGAVAELEDQQRRGLEVTRTLARLYLADDSDELSRACDETVALLNGPAGLNGRLRACALLLVGWSKLRLRHMSEAIVLLNEAMQRCWAEGLGDLGERARAGLLFSKAFNGDFAGALAGIEATPIGPVVSVWRRVDGGVDSYIKGWVEFWSGDLAAAMREFGRGVSYGEAVTPFESLSRLMLVHAALARGNAAEIAEAESALAAVPEQTIQGVPWRHYKLVSQAGISLYRGDRVAALRELDEATRATAHTPGTTVFAAQLYWRCGSPEKARAQTAQLMSAPSYLRASGLVVLALCARAEGDLRTASARLEEALGLCVGPGITRPFRMPDPAMTELLVAHAAHGTRFEAFLAERIAESLAHYPALGEHEELSAREKEVLSYLATTMSATEISSALFVSQNTLKTHVRSIYRKLGVDNRRDAARFLRLL